MHSEVNYQQNEKLAYWMGEVICKWYFWYGVHIPNILRTHPTQCQKTKQPNWKMHRESEWTFFQIRHTDGQQVLEKMLTITSHQGNVNQTTMRYHFTAVRMAIIKKTRDNKGWWE